MFCCIFYLVAVFLEFHAVVVYSRDGNVEMLRNLGTRFAIKYHDSNFSDVFFGEFHGLEISFGKVFKNFER